jgi:hypothetical protein
MCFLLHKIISIQAEKINFGIIGEIKSYSPVLKAYSIKNINSNLRFKIIKLSLYRPWRPIGLRNVEAPTFSRQSPPPPAAREETWYSFLSDADWRPQSHSAAGKVMSIENCNDLIRNRTSDFPGCSIFL